MRFGITERGDASVHLDEWKHKLVTVDAAILITKDPLFLFDHLSEFDPSNCIFHCTITGWGGSYLEPGVPDAGKAMIGYSKLLATFGPERVVLRIDPIMTSIEGIAKAVQIYSLRGGRTRISFMDMYPHVRARLQKIDNSSAENILHGWDKLGCSLHAPLKDRIMVKDAYFSEAEVCGEPGMECSGCVSERDLSALNRAVYTEGRSQQRKACCCLAAKTELLTHRSPCRHGCLYCYWKS